MMIDVPKRNRAIKALLETTYGKGCASVRAGSGTAYRWVEIAFKTMPDALAPFCGKYHPTYHAVEALIRGAGIELSYYNADDMGGRDMIACVTIAMPRAAQAAE